MEKTVKTQLERLQKIRLPDGSPVVWDGENPVLNLDHAIIMTQRAGLLYRFSMDGRNFEYRITEPMSVQRCSIVQAPALLCALVEEAFLPTEAEIEEWEPTPEYAEELAGEVVPEAPE